ncbi:putative O-acetyltransferase CAS1 [Fusarium oxysporum f. sp. albedinis]|nr:putative O-acetyltransferase CAS1 [Fusarium oxysporum f. sp. albedinis]
MFDLDIELDPLTNRVYLGEYYNLCFVFLTKPSSSFAEFVSVKNDGYTKQEDNKYRIIPFQTAPRFQVENHQKPSQFDFRSVVDEDFPMAWINGNDVPIQEFSLDSGPFPVMELKFIIEKGASVLTISGNSKVFDMTGLCVIIRMLAKACSQESFTSLEISGMENHAAFFHNDNKMQRHDRIPVRFVPDLLLPQTTSFQERNIKWALFSFDQDALQDIVDMNMSSDSLSQYLVGTDKALTAFVL